jgi:hypothetical protein
MRYTLTLVALAAFGTGPLPAAAPASPRPIPATRQEMKKALENLKKAQPRLPLPPLSDAEKESAGTRPLVNNARMRQLYLPAELRSTDFQRGPDPNQSLDPTFKTMLFWIVSRGNNCHY